MKSYIISLLALVLFAGGAWGQTPDVRKRTFDYAVREADTLRLDVYDVAAAEGAAVEARPCLMFVFGGGFVTGNRDRKSYMRYFEHYARKGYVVASMDYRLGMKSLLGNKEAGAAAFMMTFAGAVTMAVEDLFAATSYIVARAGELGVDPARIVASGSSAGAITVLHGEYEICNSTPLALAGLPAGFDYAGVVSFAGAILSLGELKWQRMPAPIMLFHGDADSNVPYDALVYEGMGFYGSKHIARQLTEMGAPHYFYSVENMNHMMATRPMTDNMAEIDTFLDKMVIGGRRLIIDENVRDLKRSEVKKNFTLEEYIRTNFGK